MKILELLTPKRKIGNKGEAQAAAYLKKHGYKIIERNYVAFGNEIDIVAESKDTLAFIEVKTRTVGRENPKEPRPASAVTPDKQRKIICAAKYYLGSRSVQKEVSLDVIEVYLTADGKILNTVHMKNAFTRNTAYGRP
ncbi:MAG: YraN family protein [Clostridia bacterium]|nr:YraN family protein [Clostridia bacterium]